MTAGLPWGLTRPLKSPKTTQRATTRDAKEATMSTTAPPPQTIADLLSQLPDPAPDQTPESYLTSLSTTAQTAQIHANAYRIKLGLTMLAGKPKVRSGVGAWETTHAERLGIDVRQVRKYCATAQVVSAMGGQMPVTALDRPLTKVVAEAKQLQAGQPSDKPPRKPREPYTEAVRAVVRLLQQVEPEGQVAWLDAFGTAVEVAQAEELGRAAPMD